MTRIVTHLLEPGSDLAEVDRFRRSVAELLVLQDCGHEAERIGRARWSAPRFDSEVIVSHLRLGWARVPFLVALRACHPSATLIHVAQAGEWGCPNAEGTARTPRADLLRPSLALFDLVMVTDRLGRASLTDARLVDEVYEPQAPSWTAKAA